MIAEMETPAGMRKNNISSILNHASVGQEFTLHQSLKFTYSNTFANPSNLSLFPPSTLSLFSPTPPSLPIRRFTGLARLPFLGLSSPVSRSARLMTFFGCGLTCTNRPLHFPHRCFSGSMLFECLPYSVPQPGSSSSSSAKNALAASCADPLGGADWRPAQTQRYLWLMA